MSCCCLTRAMPILPIRSNSSTGNCKAVRIFSVSASIEPAETSQPHSPDSINSGMPAI